MSTVDIVLDRRKPSKDETIQLWLNVVSAVLLVTPMLMTDLKPLLPAHYYGVLSSIIASINAGISTYRRMQYGGIVIVEKPEVKA